MKQNFHNTLLALAIIISAFFTGSQAFSADYSRSLTRLADTLFVTGDINIPDRDSLIIPAGTIVKFTGHYAINVHGKLIAAGTEADSIIFTVTDTLGFSNMYIGAGGWAGIRFEDVLNDNDSSVFAYCHFEFGKATGDSANCYGGAVRLVRYDKVRVSNSTFTNNYAFMRGAGIHAFKSDLLIEHCHFSNNFAGNDTPEIYGYGAGVNIVSSEPDIRFCTFVNNKSTGIGGGISFEYSNPEMINCVFENNFSALGGAIGFLRCAPDRTIANILVINNTAMFFGGGIANITASPRLSNFTITGNYAAMGGGYYCNEYAFPKLYNSVLYGNFGGEPGNPFGSQVWIWDVYSAPEFHNCDVQFGVPAFGGSMFIGVYENNIEVDPLFVDPANLNFKLQPASPCINAGTPDTSGLMLPSFDLDLKPRIFSGRIDIGAYEYIGTMPVVLPGDANCDEVVNVLDVITIVNFITGLNPEPFCYENADINTDGTINVLDVIGTTNIILQKR